MDDLDKKKFAEIMYGLAEDFSVEVSKPWLLMKFDLLKEFTIDEVLKASLSIMANWEYQRMPPTAIFLKYLGRKEITSNSKAQIEADKIISHLRAYGQGAIPVLVDPISKHLMLKRWPYVNWAKTVLESQITWWTKEFIEAYKAYDETDKQQFLEAPKNVLKLLDGIGTETET